MKILFHTCLLAVMTSPCCAQGVRYTVANDTGGIGGATYPVTTPVQFSSLSLTLLFADSTTQTDPLADVVVSGTKNSAVYPLVGPHGAIMTATLSGIFSTVNWQERATFSGAKTAITVSNPFSASESGGTFKFAYIDGTDTTSGLSYHAGNLSSSPAAFVAVTPEPGAVVLLAACAGTLLAFRRRPHAATRSSMPTKKVPQ